MFDIFVLRTIMDPISIDRCAVCGTSEPKDLSLGKLTVCGGCRNVSFCSRECENQMRKAHRSECERIGQQILNATKPDKPPLTIGLLGHEQLVEDLIAADQISQALLYVTVEQNRKLALDWFRNRLKKQLHPIMCLEFACFLKTHFSKENTLMEEAFAYKELGLTLVQADTLCMENDKSITVLTFLEYNCQFPSNPDKKEQPPLQEKLANLKEELLASPLWILNYPHCCPKECTPKPREEWNSIRLNFLKNK